MLIEEADYVVVGAGSAGCAVAARLSEDMNRRVVLLEAGGSDWHPLIHIPLMTRLTSTLGSLNWGYATEPEPNLGGRSLVWPRGKVLGGSSAINGMTYIRGHRRDFDDWRQAGCAGWAYDDVLPYFKRSERNPKGGPYHGSDGPVGVSPSPVKHALDEPFMQACAALGLARTDFNGAEQEGFALHDFTIINGRRQSTARGYLWPARGRPNLAVVTRAQATRVLFEGRRAVGVEFVRGRERRIVRASREVVLSGGAINSPQLLMLSGIGAAAALRRLGIAALVDLPAVGRNLQDHLGLYIAQECTQPVTFRQQMRYDRLGLAVLQAFLLARGPATAVPINACAFMRTRPELEIPDVQITLIPGLVGPWQPPRADGIVTVRQWHRPDREGFLVHAYQLRPESRGDITLASADPLAKPIIRGNYLATETDRRTLRDGLRLIRRIIAGKAFDPFRGPELRPGPVVADDDAIDAWVRANATTAYHPVGTCRMGGDAEAVVDPELRVRGVEGLRVADASVMPTIVGGNTNAAAIMIGEKAADLVLGRRLPRAEAA
jgi:choline dehydrogenase